MPLSPHRRNPAPRRPVRPPRARGRDLAPPAPGYPPRAVIAGWRAELLRNDDWRMGRGRGAASPGFWRAWWRELDLATASDEEVAEVWMWLERETADPSPLAWDVLLEVYGGDRDALKRALADELARREAS